MDFDSLRRTWDRFGEIDAMGAILTRDGGLGGWTAERFFETGREEIGEVLASLHVLGAVPERKRALDFGCGIGRLTQALCEHFEECHGVDVAPSMIRHAERLNRHGARARYHLNERTDLAVFPDGYFDFVYSNLVLQHMRPAFAHGYLREFVRVLAPGGVLVFQLPSEPCCDPAPPTPALGAHHAGIEVETAPEELEAGATGVVVARVRNLGDVAWPGSDAPGPEGPFALGNHWLDAGGAVLVNDDGRTPLPRSVAPGAETRLELAVRAPREPGSYLLEIDLVHEGVCWFAGTGSRTVRLPVCVTRPAGAAEGDAPPRMEVYGTPRARVVALLEEAGARVLDVQRYDAAGPAWASYRYVAAKG